MAYRAVAYGRTIALAALLATALLTIGGGQAWSQTAADHIKLGGLMSLTGAAAGSGASVRAGVEMAVRDINKSGGAKGRPFDLLLADDQSDATIAVGEAKRLVFEQKVNLMAGPIFSAPVLAVAPIYTQGKVAAVGAVSSQKFTPDFAPYMFAMLPTIHAQSQAVLDYLKARGFKTMAVLADNGQNSKELIEGIKADAGPTGLTITRIEEYPYGAPDTTPQLFSLRRDNPDVIVINSLSGTDFGHIRKTMEDIGWKIPVSGTTSVGLSYREIVHITGPDLLTNVAGITFTATTYCPSDPVGQSPYARFVETLKGFAPGKFEDLSSLNAAAAYDGVMLLRAAVNGVGSTDAAALANWVETNSFDSVLGRFTASKATHFLYGPGTMVASDHYGTSESPRTDGLVRRAGC